MAVFLGIAFLSFSFFWSGHRDQVACSLLGGFSKPRTAATQSLDSVPIFRIMCYVPLMALVPPSLSPPPRFPRLSSMSPENLPARASLSPPLASYLYVFRLFAAPPPVAPVVTRCPPVRLTGCRCHDTPSVLTSVPMFGGLPPQPMRLVLIGSGVGRGA